VIRYNIKANNYLHYFLIKDNLNHKYVIKFYLIKIQIQNIDLHLNDMISHSIQTYLRQKYYDQANGVSKVSKGGIVMHLVLLGKLSILREQTHKFRK